jgi:hypothetical protein
MRARSSSTSISAGGVETPSRHQRGFGSGEGSEALRNYIRVKTVTARI